jgi:hypothetical protein
MAIRRDDNKYTRLSLQQYNGQARNGEIVIDLDTYNVYVGDASGTLLPISNGGGNLANAIIGNLTVTGTSNLGLVGNVTILGGNVGDVLSTDGTGNLSWIAVGGGPGNYSNANVANYLPVYTGNLDSVGQIAADGNITVNTGYFFLGDGGLLSNVYSAANLANDLPNYSGNLNNVNSISATGNITTTAGVTATGNIAGGNVSSNGNVTATGNVTGGNLATSGNLTVSGTAGVGSLDTTLITGDSLTLQTTGTNQGINLDPNGTGNINVNNSVINNIATPVQAGDAANKQYVDGVASGLQIKPYVNVSTTTVLPSYTYNNGASGVGATITATSSGALFLSGLPVATGQRVLIKDEVGPNAPYNGIYTVTASGTAGTPFILTRATDDDTPSLAYSAYTFDDYSNTGWVCLNTATNNPITFGTTPIEFTQFSQSNSYAAGLGLSLVGQLFNVNPDNTTIAINGSNQVSVKPGAQLVNPNIGNATATSIAVSGNVTAGNTTTTGTTTTNSIVSNSSTVVGNSTVGGNLTTSGNIAAAGVVTDNFYYANGTPITFVNRIVAGNNITISPIGGTGAVTINSSGGNGTANVVSIPQVYFTATANGNNQSFSNVYLSQYATASDMTVFYNGALLEDGYYTLSGDTITVTTSLRTGDSVDIIRQFANIANIVPQYVAIPAVYFTAPTTGNNQTFSNTYLTGYGNTDDLTVFYNGSLLGEGFYTLTGDTLTVDTVLNSGDSISITRQVAGNIGTISSSYSNVNANAFMAAGLVGDIIPAGNNAANLGSSASQFKDLFLSNSTIYFNNIPLSVGTANGVANTLLFNSLPVVTSDGNSNITTSGNVIAGKITANGNITANTGYYFLGDGGLISNLTVSAGSQISDGTCNVDVNGTTANIITMGANGVANIATFDESNATFIGSVIASQYFYPNGIPITINYANSNVFSYLPTYDGDLPLVGNIVADGNVTANAGYFFIGDGSLLTGTYANTNVANYLPGYTGNLDSVGNITATGNLVAGNLDVTPGGSIAFGSGGNVYSIPTGGLTGTVTVNGINDRGISLTAGGTTPGSSYSQIQWVQDINTYDPYSPAGSITNWVYTQFDGTYIENFDLLNAPGYNYTWKFGIDGNLTAAGNITTPGNITAGFFIGDGGLLSNIATGSNYSNANVANYLPTYTGNLINVNRIVASGNVSVANLTVSGKSVLGAVGNVTITGGTIGQTLTTNGSGVLSWATPAPTYGNANVANYLPTYTGNIGAGNVNVVTKVTTNSVSLGTGNLQLSGNLISTTSSTITIDPLGDGSSAGNVIVQGNMQVVGSLTYNNVVNATTNDLQWIAANNAINQAAASGGGLSVGPSGAYASLTYNAPANAWQSSLPIIATDGVNANGALSGATTGSFSGNVTADYFIGNGSQLTDIISSYTDSNVEAYLPTYTGNLNNVTSIAAIGNITGGNLISNQDIFGTGVLTLAQSFVSPTSVTMRILVDGDTSFIQVGNGVGGSTGNIAFAPYFDGTGSVVINTDSGNINAGNVITTANIIGAYILGNGSQLTDLPISNSIANGTSSVTIAAADGPVTTTVGGTVVARSTATTIALGATAATTNQQTHAIAIGANAAQASQGANAIAIGAFSGGINQAANSIAIGANAQTAAAAIVLNASGANLLGGSAGFYVNPVRNDTTAANTTQAVTYNTTSKELTYTNTLNLTGTVQAVDFIAGDASNASSTKTRIAYFGANSYIQTGNGTAGTTGNIIFSPYASAVAKVIIDTTTGNITANNIGNIAAVNLNGNASSYLTGAGTWSSSSGINGLRNITKISKGYGYGATLMIADGRLYTMKGNGGDGSWFSALYNQNTSSFSGVNDCYEITFPDETVGTIVDADSYGYSAYALFANGDLYTWGYNGYGQLGIGSTTNSFFPTLSNTNVAQVYTHTSQQSSPNANIQRLVIRKTNNTFFGCGHDGQGQLGLGTTTNKVSWTAMPWIPTDVLSVWNLGGDLGNIFIQLANGTLQATGYNARGQLGVGNYTATYTTPVNTNGWLGGDATMRIQSFGWGGPYNGGGGQENYCNITMFLDNGTTSRIVTAGDNNWGSSGTNNFTSTNVPVTPVTSTGLTGRVTKMLFAGSAPKAVYALTSTGDLYGWGWNGQGQLSTGTQTAQGAPYLIAADVLDIMGDVQGWDLSGYFTTSPFIKKSAGWYVSGFGAYGQLGNGTLTTNQLFLSRVILPKGIDFKFIGCYSGSNEGLTRYGVGTDNTIWAWGYNSLGAIDPVQTGYQIVVPTQFKPNALRT